MGEAEYAEFILDRRAARKSNKLEVAREKRKSKALTVAQLASSLGLSKEIVAKYLDEIKQEKK